ncbi:MAG TPA: endonuclease III [Nostocaceae cyanobacterium]|nr:endonuclease III [Nostocaceae cyanobacterium]
MTTNTQVIETILSELKKSHPNAKYELDWDTPLQLLVATILAAQCTDERVNKVTKTLFVKYANAQAYAQADILELVLHNCGMIFECRDVPWNVSTRVLDLCKIIFIPNISNALELEQNIKPTGFYRKKAETIQSVCQELVKRFGGEVPQTMAEMVTLPGVARKTANVVLNTAFNLPTGIIVDVHVARVSQRMGLSKKKVPEKIEQDLMELVPQSEWTFFGPAMVLHGRYTCTAKNPNCSECPFEDICEKNGI